MIRLNRKGFTLVEIMIVVAIIGLLVVIAIPNFVRARATARKNLCINNMRLIDHAKYQWAIEFNKVGSDTPTSASVAEYMRDNTYPTCADAGTYTIANINTAASCSIHGTLLRQ